MLASTMSIISAILQNHTQKTSLTLWALWYTSVTVRMVITILTFGSDLVRPAMLRLPGSISTMSWLTPLIRQRYRRRHSAGPSRIRIPASTRCTLLTCCSISEGQPLQVTNSDGQSLRKCNHRRLTFPNPLKMTSTLRTTSLSGSTVCSTLIIQLLSGSCTVRHERLAMGPVRRTTNMNRARLMFS